MKMPALLLSAVLVAGLPLARAQSKSPYTQPAASRKASKQAMKAQKKYAKQQKKAEKKMLKTEKKGTHYPPQQF